MCKNYTRELVYDTRTRLSLSKLQDNVLFRWSAQTCRSSRAARSSRLSAPRQACASSGGTTARTASSRAPSSWSPRSVPRSTRGSVHPQLQLPATPSTRRLRAVERGRMSIRAAHHVSACSRVGGYANCMFNDTTKAYTCACNGCPAGGASRAVVCVLSAVQPTSPLATCSGSTERCMLATLCLVRQHNRRGPEEPHAARQHIAHAAGHLLARFHLVAHKQRTQVQGPMVVHARVGGVQGRRETRVVQRLLWLARRRGAVPNLHPA